MLKQKLKGTVGFVSCCTKINVNNKYSSISQGLLATFKESILVSEGCTYIYILHALKKALLLSLLIDCCDYYTTERVRKMIGIQVGLEPVA